MIFGAYQFHCHFEGDAVLPPFKGSTFRGSFGHALKKVVCALKQQECESCLLRHNCIYTNIFETNLSAAKSTVKNGIAPPAPFVIEPPISATTEFSKGDPFNFNLLLFGDANEKLPYFIYAFEQMGQTGIGRKTNGSRGRYRLDEVLYDENRIYSADERILHQPENYEILQWDISRDSQSHKSRLEIALHTPLRFKMENQLSSRLPFDAFVRVASRRAAALLNAYSTGEPDIDYRHLVEAAGQIKTLSKDLRWYDWRRYSHRQKNGMRLGGLIGTIVYEGDIGPFVPLIELCSKVHIGKQTTFGLGKFTARYS